MITIMVSPVQAVVAATMIVMAHQQHGKGTKLGGGSIVVAKNNGWKEKPKNELKEEETISEK